MLEEKHLSFMSQERKNSDCSKYTREWSLMALMVLKGSCVGSMVSKNEGCLVTFELQINVAS